ncbi:MAG TPA: endonuclease, partial [Porphyromonadaceae bacterium]|nr:endonuclease [Porphyromonadaceae bacterium]
MADHNELGWKGEEAAANYLASKGHRIVERNWTFRGYEVDIISEDDGYIVFVEV